MCMSCVASATPMITVGLTVMRRRTLLAWARARLRPDGGSTRAQRSRSLGAN
jgi:hypothetical protein